MELGCVLQYTGWKNHQEIGLYPVPVHGTKASDYSSNPGALHIENHCISYLKSLPFRPTFLHRYVNSRCVFSCSVPLALGDSFRSGQGISKSDTVFPGQRSASRPTVFSG